MSSPVSRGFRHLRRPSAAKEGRVPPGQYVTQGFPVLSARPTPHTPLPEWTFSIRQGGDTLKSWTWQEFRALPAETVTVDIHCVTRWSKLDTVWRGVSVDTLLDQVEHDAPYVLAFCDGGYTTNLPVKDVTGGQAWVAFDTTASRSKPSTAAGPPAGAAPVLLEEREMGSGPWNCSTTTCRVSGRPTATTSTEIHGGNSGTRAIDLAGRPGELGDDRDGRGPHDRAGRARLAGVPGRAAPGCPADRRGRLHPGAVLSIAAAGGEPVAITVERLEDGEVSPYLTGELRAGDELELGGPIGRWFVWDTSDSGPLLVLDGNRSAACCSRCSERI